MDNVIPLCCHPHLWPNTCVGQWWQDNKLGLYNYVDCFQYTMLKFISNNDYKA